MRNVRAILGLTGVAITLAAAAAAAAAELSRSQLAERPEFWPAQCTLQAPVTLPSHKSLPAGQRLTLLAVRAHDVEVETADAPGSFPLPMDATDVLAAARASYRSLTPEQRALTYATVLARKDLWPYRVNLTGPVRLGPKVAQPGETCILKGVEGGELLLLHERSGELFNVSPQGTDLIDSARRRRLQPAAFPGRVAEDLAGKLISPLTSEPAPLDSAAEPLIYVFYRGAAWCVPCRQFSPSLAQFQKEMKPTYPGFEIIYVSADTSAAEMAAYAQEAGFSWRTVSARRLPELPIVSPFFTTAVPQLIVTDRHGNVLVNSMPAGPQLALKQLAVVLKRGAAAAGKSPLPSDPLKP